MPEGAGKLDVVSRPKTEHALCDFNLDLTIVCEAPKISPHVAAMKAAIAGTCGIAPGRVAIKATTSEQLGFTGRGEGLMAMATATVELPREN